MRKQVSLCEKLDKLWIPIVSMDFSQAWLVHIVIPHPLFWLFCDPLFVISSDREEKENDPKETATIGLRAKLLFFIAF